jgi:hypothetical protein
MTCQYPAPTSGALDEALETLAKKNRFIAEENGIPYDGFKDEMDGARVAAYLGGLTAQLAEISLAAEDGDLITREIVNAARFAAHGAKLHDALRGNGKGFAALAEELAQILAEHEALWHARNKPGGYARSTEQLSWLISFYRNADI